MIENIIKLVVLSALLDRGQCVEWHLTWHDEFEQGRLLEDKWDIEDSGNRCQEPFESQLNCMTAHKRNVRVLNGTLAITAIHQGHKWHNNKLTKPFTSGYIYSSQYFTLGRFEVRAAMPRGELLRAQLNLYEPYQHDNTWVGIAIADYKSRAGQFEVGMFEMGGNWSHFHLVNTSHDLHQFNDYTIVWHNNLVHWFFNGLNVHTFDYRGLPQDLRERLNGQMEVEIDLVVGGPHMAYTFSQEQIGNWSCPTVIVDYVRVYKESSERQINATLQQSMASAEDICSLVKEVNSLNDTGVSQLVEEESQSPPPPPLSSSSSRTTLLIVVGIIVAISILVVIIVFLLLKVKKHKKTITKIAGNIQEQHAKEADDNMYTDIRDELDIYHPFDLNYENVDENYDKLQGNVKESEYLGIYDDTNANKSQQNDGYGEMTTKI